MKAYKMIDIEKTFRYILCKFKWGIWSFSSM